MLKQLAIASLALNFIAPLAQADSWLKGDFHVHTFHSGGDSTVPQLANAAQSLGLDFIAITDHDDKMNGIPLTWDEMAKVKNPATTLIYGMEWTHGVTWTTCHGHMNLWSDRPFEYRGIWEANEADDADLAQRLAQDQGVLFSINHAKLFGFGWEYDFPDNLPSMEIWNGAFGMSNSRKTMNEVWSAYYDRGIRVTGVGGSDTHELHGMHARLTTLGNPTTWVYSKTNTAKAILEGVKAGHVALSFAPKAPVAMLTADAELDGKFESIPGDNISPGHGLASFKIDVLGGSSGAKPESIHLYKNGQLYRSFDATRATSVKFVDRVKPGERSWYFVELHGKTGFSEIKGMLYGDLLSISNPITLGFK